MVASGVYHTVALKNDGTVVAWGYNGYGQTNVPATATGVTQVAAGYAHTVAPVTFTDCNANGQRDSYELAHGGTDVNANGIPDECEQLVYDLDRNDIVDAADVALLLLDFGACAGCPTDLAGSGTVDNGDMSLVLLNFGPVG
jgi:alpha-tubulin suppressor-like RCC1 family protein